MGDDKAVQRLIEIFSAFYTEGKQFEEDLTFSITNEFNDNMRRIMLTKQLLSYRRWGNYFKACMYKMDTPEMYLRYLFYACRQYAYMYMNIFERFLNVFALMLHLRVVTLDTSSTDFSKLIPDIFMAFYESELKKSFGRCGGFHRLVEYINNPKFIAPDIKDVPSNFIPGDATNKYLEKQLSAILREEKALPKGFRFEDAEIDRPSITLAQKIIKNKKIELPSNVDLKTKLVEIPQQLKDKLGEEIRILEGEVKALEVALESCSKPHSETNNVVMNNAQCESIIQAVIKFNRSTISDEAIQNNPFLKEACGILKRLEGNIKSFIELLEEYDQE